MLCIKLQLHYVLLNIFPPGLIQAVHAKTAESHVSLHGNLFGPISATEPIKSSKDLASLVVCTRIKFFGCGM